MESNPDNLELKIQQMYSDLASRFPQGRVFSLKESGYTSGEISQLMEQNLIKTAPEEKFYTDPQGKTITFEVINK